MCVFVKCCLRYNGVAWKAVKWVDNIKFKIDNEEDAQEYIEKIRKDNLSARHVVYIYSYFTVSIKLYF